jgi:serine/threonine protein kinase
MLCMRDNRPTGLRLLLWALPGAHSSFPSAQPANVLLDGAGTPLLCDFGIARALSATLGQHAVTSPAGTLNYM